jgi:2-polyprenyl-3-methyl-5-hydroxy-6-metoxy-1,4-benzoquinol methylase
VAGCCSQSEYRRLFNRKVAAKDARRFRKRGLTGTALTLATLAGDVRGASVLDIGGGIGAIELELLESGAERATSIELSGAYEQEAEALLGERGLDARVERRVGDFVADASFVEPHDVVVLHRVVCCYPDMEALVGEAADHARRTLLLTYPQDRVVIRAGVRVINLVLRISRCGFRTYAHRVERILTVAAEHGFALQTRQSSGVLWETVALGRPDV